MVEEFVLLKKHHTSHTCHPSHTFHTLHKFHYLNVCTKSQPMCLWIKGMFNKKKIKFCWTGADLMHGTTLIEAWGKDGNCCIIWKINSHWIVSVTGNTWQCCSILLSIVYLQSECRLAIIIWYQHAHSFCLSIAFKRILRRGWRRLPGRILWAVVCLVVICHKKEILGWRISSSVGWSEPCCDKIQRLEIYFQSNVKLDV